MLQLIDYTINKTSSNVLAPEEGDLKTQKVLIINTRSYHSDLLDQERIESELEGLAEGATRIAKEALPSPTHEGQPAEQRAASGAQKETQTPLPSRQRRGDDIVSKEYISEMADDLHAQKRRRDFFLDIIKKNDDLWKEGVPNFDVVQVPILQLSADQTVHDWMQLAYLIEKNYYQYTGFVISHGTDTVVYIATALSFMLENLGKPVIFTGSLIPAECIYTDMKRNLILSLMVANCRQLTEVCILFDDRLYRANRCLKVSRSNLKPYDSPHFPPLAVMEGSMRLIGPLLRPQPHGKLRVMPHMDTKILSIELGPCTPLAALLLAVETTKAKAVVLACYGSGNGPSRDNFMSELMKLAKARQLLVVITTQNRYGGVNLPEYELGRKLLALGAVSAGNMTQEATFVKLKYLFGLGLSADTVRTYLTKDLRGEISFVVPKL